jgi:aryl-alcohol dehydrogenase-like predicted oxidoreductase
VKGLLGNVGAALKSPIGRKESALEPEKGERLGFGCAGLMRIPARAERQGLLAAAFEQGIRHFDVARMYGLGAAEAELGRFAAGRREELSIATKFGIEASGAAGRLARVQAPARAALARFPRLRAAVKRRQDSFHEPRSYDVDGMRKSLETSLAELGTDYVDVLFIHGPEAGDQVDIEGLAVALEDLRHAGRIRAWGLAGNPRPCIALAEAMGEADIVLQVRDEIGESLLEQVSAATPLVTFGVLSPTLQRVLDRVGAGDSARAAWSEAVGRDCGDPDVVASLLLQDALDRNPDGAVLFSTTRPERIASAVAAARALGGEPEALAAFRRQVAAGLGGAGERDG